MQSQQEKSPKAAAPKAAAKKETAANLRQERDKLREEIAVLELENEAIFKAFQEFKAGNTACASPEELAALTDRAESAEQELGQLQFATEEHIKTLTNRIAELEVKADNAGKNRKDRILDTMREAVAGKISELHNTYENEENQSALIDKLTLKISVFRKLCAMRDKYRENIQTCNKFLESTEGNGTISFGYNRDLTIHSADFVIAMTNAYSAGAMECIETLDQEIRNFNFKN